MVKQYNGTVKIGAIDTYYPICKVATIKNKLEIDWEYPTFIFFDIDNRMYYFDGILLL